MIIFPVRPAASDQKHEQAENEKPHIILLLSTYLSWPNQPLKEGHCNSGIELC
jgi:hypothetical protein